jgi:CAAX protease family protein
MDSLNLENPPLLVRPECPRRVWKFWGTALWGLFIFAAMFVGQIAVVIFFLLKGGGPLELAEAVKVVASSGLAIALSIIAGLPAVAAALWLAIRWTPMSFAEYLALRWTNWRNVVIGVIGLVALVEGWDLLSKATGRDVMPDFMIDVLKSARGDGAVSSLVWTIVHMQYDWFFLGQVFCIGLWFGYIRYRSNSTWLTIVLHGLNNFGALVQTIWLAG